MPLLRLPGRPIQTGSYSLFTGLKFRNALNRKSYPTHTRSFSSPVVVISAMSSLFSHLDPLDLHFWSPSSILHLSHVSKSQTAFRHAAPQLWNKLPHFVPAPRFPHCSPSSLCSYRSPPVNLSHGVFHSRLKTHLFSKSFPP